ncbi:hypothetical protein [Lysinibacillus sp. RC79]|uniref:hypothetical protein n=1 Tax=Lysinibacillus sp. RC79 TaxID=3156296 RepID=UPI00351376EF
MANAFLHEYSGSKALAISSNELPKPNPTSFEQILKQLAKAEQTREEKEKPSPTARAIQGFTGYIAFIEKEKLRNVLIITICNRASTVMLFFMLNIYQNISDG